MPTLPLHPDTPTATVVARRPRRLRRRLVAAGIGAAVVVPLVGVAYDRVTGWSPLEQQVVDRSTPPLLLALDDLAEYHAATGSFQVVIDQERDTPYVPSVISGERTSLLATGSVDAYVDLTDLGPQRVQLSADGTSATITLPAPRLDEPTVDPARRAGSSTATGGCWTGWATPSSTSRSTTPPSTPRRGSSWPLRPQPATCRTAPRRTPGSC